jgi:hypothetical protein
LKPTGRAPIVMRVNTISLAEGFSAMPMVAPDEHSILVFAICFGFRQATWLIESVPLETSSHV